MAVPAPKMVRGSGTGRMFSTRTRPPVTEAVCSTPFSIKVSLEPKAADPGVRLTTKLVSSPIARLSRAASNLSSRLRNSSDSRTPEVALLAEARKFCSGGEKGAVTELELLGLYVKGSGADGG